MRLKPAADNGALLAAVDAELARRDALERRTRKDEIRASCRSLHGFVKAAWHILEPATPFVDGWVIEAICLHLEAVTDGRIKRLLINVPPGFAKSLIVSVFWPAWQWGPAGLAWRRALSTSYSEDNVIRDNNKMRRLVESDWYQDLWGDTVSLARDQNAKRKFENTATGGREGRAFIGMTGGRGDDVIIDDPHSTTSAESDVQRASTVLTFREAIPDRINNDLSTIVVIMQRLHDQDVSGTILSLKLPYVHLCIPMEFETDRRCRTAIGWEDPRTYAGELAFPERFSRAFCDAMRKAKGEYAWAGQYQQRPAPREGGLFKTGRITIVDALPAGRRRRVRAWDLAATREKPGVDPDYTAGVRMSRNPDTGEIFIEHVERFRDSPLQVQKTMRSTATQDGYATTIRFPQDPGQAGKSQVTAICTNLAGYPLKFAQPTGDKVTRATPFAAQVEAGNVYLLKGDWNDAFLDEMRTFPAGSHDDQVDAAADAFNELADVTPGGNVAEYYRLEAERIMAENTRPAVILDPLGVPEGAVALFPPEGVSTCYGREGDFYTVRPDGTMAVKEIDVGPLLAHGFKRPPEPESDPEPDE